MHETKSQQQHGRYSHCPLFSFYSVSPAELAARASPTSGNPRGRTADLRLDFKSPHSGSLPPGTIPPQVKIQKGIYI